MSVHDHSRNSAPPQSPVIGAAADAVDDVELRPPPMEASGANTAPTLLTEADLIQVPIVGDAPDAGESTAPCPLADCICSDRRCRELQGKTGGG